MIGVDRLLPRRRSSERALRRLTPFILAAVGFAPLSGQLVRVEGRLVPGDTVIAVASRAYEAGPLHRFVLGGGHRDVWSLPVPAEVLDLDRFAGGLSVEGLGGGNQTRSLRFTGADGRQYNFRSIDKDASRTLEPELRRSAAAWILQDQISSLFPLSAMVVEPLLDAVDVLHPTPLLRVMPDDPRLGEFRPDFRGLLGWIEERPNENADGGPGFAGSSRVVGTERLFELIEESPRHRVSVESLLKARLIDALVGDWDRHPGQWRWARFDDGAAYRYEPVPRDRDWSFADIDGAITWFTWIPWPQYMGFSESMGSAFRRTYSGQVLDRMFLSHLPRGEWDRVTAEVVEGLSDEVITDAVARLPESYGQVRPDLESALKRRRNELPAFSRAFYELLADYVDVHTTDEDEVALVVGEKEGVRVSVYLLDDGRRAVEPHFERLFVDDETREVRLDLHGGDDRVEVSGPPWSGVLVRVLGGGGDDRFEDRSEGSRVRFYDTGKETVVVGGTPVDPTDWDKPYDPEDRTDWIPARDWGHRSLPVPVVGYEPDWGVVVGLGVRREWYGFRSWPYKAAMEGGLGIATETGRPTGHAEIDLPLSRHARVRLRGDLQGAEIRRFYGFGNDTDAPGDDDLYEAQRRELRAAASVVHSLGEGMALSTGLVYRHLEDLGNPGTRINARRPYGFPDFQQVGLTAGLGWAGLDPEGLMSTPNELGFRFSFFPSTLDVSESFFALEASGAASLSLAPDLSVDPVLAGRLGGRKVWGRFPYHEAATLGGSADLRGYPNQRFSGHASAFFNAELRFAIGSVFLLLPGDVGVFGLFDGGRVFWDESESGKWHTAFGGGLWLSFLDAYSARLTVADGSETAMYLSVGFPF